MKDSKTIQTLASVSLIGGPLSIIIGGVVLSTAALVCGIIALVMVRGAGNVAADEAIPENIRQTLMRQAIIGIAMSGLALVMNVASLAVMLPSILDALQTGDYSSLFGGDATGGGAADPSDSGGAFGGNSGEAAPESPQSGKSSVWG